MKISALTLLHVAIGAAGASALIIVSTHLFWMVPVWARVAPAAAADSGKYSGMLLGAIMAAGIGFNAWLFSFFKVRREGRGDIRIKWLMLPLLLLLPCVIHTLEFRQYNYREIARNQAIIDQYRLQKEAGKTE